MAIQGDGKREDDLDQVEKVIAEAKKSTTARSEKVDDLSSRLRVLRHRNHFRLMLEEIFND
jgi:hypothetical protein